MRQDVGALWENFFISERIKRNHYNGSYAQSYFWRTTRQQEVDYIEIENGEISAFEMKWNPNKKGTPLPKTFEETYSPKQSIVVTPENFYEWV
jgi:predicted AAA+ superfamily ATPase